MSGFANEVFAAATEDTAVRMRDLAREHGFDRLAEHPPEKGFWFLRSHVLLTRWDYGVLVRALRDLCARAEGETWEEVATKLSRYGRWEFEDYWEL
jgi:hypothetical protein